MDEKQVIQLEMRLNAIEFLLCKVCATHLRATQPTNSVLSGRLNQFVSDAGKQVFLGLDRELSGLANSEWTSAIEKLANSIKEMLAKVTTPGRIDREFSRTAAPFRFPTIAVECATGSQHGSRTDLPQ